MEGDGMMAVVHSLPDAGLAVTLLNGGRQRTIKLNGRNTKYDRAGSAGTNVHARRDRGKFHRDSSVQAIDGQYTSTYQMMHCHVSPTSPPVEVSEFPPQRVQLNPGDGNFEIGGVGCRKSHVRSKPSDGLRNDYFWSDRVIEPRPSLQPDAFANTLRKYPSLSPDRSSEVVEKLITYPQAKYSAKRNMSSLDATRPKYDTYVQSKGRHNNNYGGDRSGIDEPLENSYKHSRYDESPTRERPRKQQDGVESWRRSTFATASDVRYLQDVTRRVKEGVRAMNANSTYTVNMKTQAAVDMVSREIATAPSLIPIHPTIDVPFSTLPLTDNETQVDILNTQVKDETQVTQSVQCISQSNETTQTDIQQTEHINESVVTSLMNDLGIPTNKDLDKENRNHLRRCYSLDHISLNNVTDDDDVINIYTTDEDDTSRHNDLFLKNNSIAKLQCDDNDQNLMGAIERWLNRELIKTRRCMDPLEIGFIFRHLFKRLKQLKNNYYVLGHRYNLNPDMYELLNETETNENMMMIIEKLTDMLMVKIRAIYKRKRRNYIQEYGNSHKNKEFETITLNNDLKSNMKLKNIISIDLHSLLENIDVSLTEDQIHVMKKRLQDVFQMFELSKGHDFIREHIKEIFFSNGLQEKQIVDFSEHLFNIFTTKTDVVTKEHKPAMVFPTISNQSVSAKRSNSQYDNTEVVISESFVRESTNLSPKSLSLANILQIVDDWFISLNLSQQYIGPNKRNIHYLASEIYDRQKYLQLNSMSNITNEKELDYLKYVIFKWNNKYFDGKSLVPLEQSVDLFNRIQNIVRTKTGIINSTYELKSKPSPNSNDNTMTCFKDFDDTQNFNIGIHTNPTFVYPMLFNTETEPQGANHSEEQIYEEYKDFIKDWVKKIPIEVSTPEEEKIAEKARLGIHNGIWKVITKLNSDPSIYCDQFYYEDLLENEIDSLLDCLPDSPQLKANRQILKIRLIEKTIDTMKSLYKSTTMSLKNQLSQKIFVYLNSLGVDNLEDSKLKCYVLNLAENFMVFTKYAGEIKGKANIYSKKISKDIDTLLKVLSGKYNKKLNTCISKESFQNDLFKELQCIHLPNNALLEEVDEILLGFEIDQWLIDLPTSSMNLVEDEYQRRKLRDILTRQLKEVDKNKITSNDIKLIELKTKTSEFLEQLLDKDENININFMTEELLNRVNNMKQTHQTNVALKRTCSCEDLTTKLQSTIFPASSAKKELDINDNIISNPNTSKNQQWNKINVESTLPTDLMNVKEMSTHNYEEFENDRPCCSTLKNANNGWYTLHDRTDNSSANKRSIQTGGNDVYNGQDSMSDSKSDDRNVRKCKKSQAVQGEFSTNETYLTRYYESSSDAIISAATETDRSSASYEKKACHDCGCNNVNILNTSHFKHRDGKLNPNKELHLIINKFIQDKNKSGIQNSNTRECQTELTEVKYSSDLPSINRNTSRDIGINVLLNNHSMCEFMCDSSNPKYFSRSRDFNETCQCDRRFRNCDSKYSRGENHDRAVFVPMFYPYPYFI